MLVCLAMAHISIHPDRTDYTYIVGHASRTFNQVGIDCPCQHTHTMSRQQHSGDNGIGTRILFVTNPALYQLIYKQDKTLDSDLATAL